MRMFGVHSWVRLHTKTILLYHLNIANVKLPSLDDMETSINGGDGSNTSHGCCLI